MPPSRRRPVPPTTPPARRPKVAGLRHPGTPADHTSPADPKSVESKSVESTELTPAEPPQAEPQPAEPTQAEPTQAEPRAGEESPAEQTAVIPVVSYQPAESTAEATAEPTEDSVPKPSPRPRHAQRRRRRAEAEAGVPADAPPAGAPAAVPGQIGGWPVMVDLRPADQAPRRNAPLVVVLVLGLVTIVFGGLAAWFGLEATAAGAANSNSALTDNVTTSQVIGQINNAVNTIFSYKYTNVDGTKNAAQNVLVGKALCQYNNLFKLVQQNAPQQKLVLTTQVVNSGVESLQGDLARVVIFADQQDTRTDTNQTSYAGAQFAVSAQRINGQWKISNIDTFTNQASTNAGC